MNLGAKLLLPFFILVVFPQVVLAHPGNTASDGCHVCRTNCAKWGEVQGARHCHGGYDTEPVYLKQPSPTRKPTASYTPKPTATSTITPTFTITNTPTAIPVVEGDSVEKDADIPTITPTPVVYTAADTVGGLGISGIFAGLAAWVVYRLIKRKRGVQGEV